MKLKLSGLAVLLLIFTVGVYELYHGHRGDGGAGKGVNLSVVCPNASKDLLAEEETNLRTYRVLADADFKSDSQAQTVISWANKVSLEMRQICEKYQLNPIGLANFTPTQGGMSAIRTRFYSKDATFEFHVPTQQLLSWENDAIRRQLNPPDHGSIPPPTARWTKAQAIEVATALLEVFTKGYDVKWTPCDAHFETGPYLNEGHVTWRASWTRLDSEGHLFRDCFVGIEFPEGYAPTEVVIPYIYPYTEVEGKRLLSLSEATAIARQAFLHEHLESTASFGLAYGATTPEVLSGRLQWIFAVGMPSYKLQEIYVDAYTGACQVGLMLAQSAPPEGKGEMSAVKILLGSLPHSLSHINPVKTLPCLFPS